MREGRVVFHPNSKALDDPIWVRDHRDGVPGDYINGSGSEGSFPLPNMGWAPADIQQAIRISFPILPQEHRPDPFDLSRF